MKPWALLKKLYQVNLIKPRGVCRLIHSFWMDGFNLMAILRFVSRQYPNYIAITDDKETISYKELFIQTLNVACCLQEKYNIGTKQKVAIAGRNHAALIKAVFAVSQSGADVYLLNTDMSKDQFNTLIQHHSFNLIIHDDSFTEIIQQSAYSQPAILTYHHQLTSINSFSNTIGNSKSIKRKSRSGNIVVLTAGTTGHFKTAARKQSATSFLSPLYCLLQRLNLNAYSTVYIATPAYHGFGFAAIVMSVLLQKRYLYQRTLMQKRL